MAIISLPVPVSPSSSTVARLVGDLPDRREDLVHRGRVADDVLEPVAVADLGAELGVLLEQLFLLPHHHPVDLDRLREERGDDVEERVVAAELLVADERLVDRQRAGRAALDLDRDAEEADRPRRGSSWLSRPVRLRKSGSFRRSGMIRGRPGRDDVPGDPFAQRILAPLDLVRRSARLPPPCAAGRSIRPAARAPRGAYPVLSEMICIDLPERLAQLQRGGKDLADLGQDGQFLVSREPVAW